MNKVLELETKLNEIEEAYVKAVFELDVLKAELNKFKSKNKWKPSLGEEYYYIDSCGNVFNTEYNASNLDNLRIRIGNCFCTPEEAEFEVERLKVIAEMREFEEDSDREWNEWEVHYYIHWGLIKNKVMIGSRTYCKHNDIYFASKEKAKECIEKVGADRIKKYYLRIEED